MLLLTTREVAKILDLCPDAVRQLARGGKLKATVIVGRGQRLFNQADVEQLHAQRVKARAKQHGAA